MATFKSNADFGTVLLCIEPHSIGFFKFILEGYDNMAIVSTTNSNDGSVLVRYPMSFHRDLMAIIAALPVDLRKYSTNQPVSSPELMTSEDLLVSTRESNH